MDSLSLRASKSSAPWIPMTFPLARRKLQDLRRDIELTDPELSRRTLESQVERFLPTVTGTPSTLYNVRHAIKRLLADWPKKSPRLISKIRKGDCEQWIATYGHLAPSTINTFISCASKFFELALTDGAITSPVISKPV